MQEFTQVQRDVAMEAALRVVLTAQGVIGVVSAMPIGSAEINGCGNDMDFIFLVQMAPPDNDVSLIVPPRGWQAGGSANADDRWESWKKESAPADEPPINILVTTDPAIFETWKVSTRVCQYLAKRLGQIDKKMRVAVHRIVQEDFKPENAEDGIEGA